MNDEVSKYMSDMGKKGMESRWKDKTKEERSAIMKEVRRKGMENKALKRKLEALPTTKS